MEHVYAALLLNQTNEELNETNLTAVLEAAGCDVVESRTKALVAALEGVDIDRIDDAAVDGVGTPDAPDAPDDGDPDEPEVAAPIEEDTDPPDDGASFTETPFTGADADLPEADGDGDGDRSDDEPATVE